MRSRDKTTNRLLAFGLMFDLLSVACDGQAIVFLVSSRIVGVNE